MTPAFEFDYSSSHKDGLYLQRRRSEYCKWLETVESEVDVIIRWRTDPIFFMGIEVGMDVDEEWQVKSWRENCDFSVKKRIIVMKCASGVGKTAVVAGDTLWDMGCLKEPNVGVKGMLISINEKNLKDNLVPEIDKLLEKSIFLKYYITCQETIVKPLDKKVSSKNWKFTCRTIPKTADAKLMGDVLRGLHSECPFIFIDEAEGVPMEAGMKALNIFKPTNVQFSRIIVIGNPTHKKSTLFHFYELCTKHGMGVSIDIHGDPDKAGCSKRIDPEQNRMEKKIYGEDHPHVLSNIKSEFYDQEYNSLISGAVVDKAVETNLTPEQYNKFDVRIGVDVARGHGKGDASSIFVRQGRKCLHYESHRKLDEARIARRVMILKKKYNSRREFVDWTGGYGSTVLHVLKNDMKIHSAVGVGFGDKADDPKEFANRKSEMWWRMKVMLEEPELPMDIPDDANLLEDLKEMKYSYLDDKTFKCYPKEKMRKEMGGRSPDGGDAGCLTFAEPDMKAGFFRKKGKVNMMPSWNTKQMMKERNNRRAS